MIRTPRYEGWFISETVIYQTGILSEDGRSGKLVSCVDPDYNGRSCSKAEWAVTLDQAKYLAEQQAESLEELQRMRGLNDYIIVRRTNG